MTKDTKKQNIFDIPIVGGGRKLIIWEVDEWGELPANIAAGGFSVGCTAFTAQETPDDIDEIFENGSWLHMGFLRPASAGVIAHECLHAVTTIHRNMGLPMWDETVNGSEEFGCYLLEWFVNRCHEVLEVSPDEFSGKGAREEE